MIPNETLQTIETSGNVAEVADFRITNETQARILISLSDKMYKRKELAAIREYACNSFDAHIVANKPIKDIVVTLPTMDDLTFKIRDFGFGLSETEIRDIYCVFGVSTKRNDNKVTGCLGYGCKSGFSVSDSFIVTSWNGGEKSIYQCIKGDTRKLHSILLLSRTASNEPSGIEVSIPVSQDKMWTFHNEAGNFFKYWKTQPTIINLSSDQVDVIKKYQETAATLFGNNWEIRPRNYGSTTAIAYMGNVPYELDWNVISDKMAMTEEKRAIMNILESNDVVLYFDMGAVNFVDSRESLEYTDTTINALMSRIDEICIKIKDSIQNKINEATSIWEAKRVYNAIFGVGQLYLNDDEDCVEVDKIKLLDGNMSVLEKCYRDSLCWNGIKIETPYFEEINLFDNNEKNNPNVFNWNPMMSVMTSYNRKKNRLKLLHCTSEKNNDILADNSVAVVLNDTGAKQHMATVAKYLLFTTNYKKVHVLRFMTDSIKNEFYKHYNFDSVPTLKMSELIAAAKKWKAENTNYYDQSGRSYTYVPKDLYYYDLEEQTTKLVEVPLEEMEEGGVFINFHESGRGYRRKKYVSVNGAGIRMEDAMKYIKTIVDAIGIDCDRIYLIDKTTAKKKWWMAAETNGNWKSVISEIKDNAAELNVTALATEDDFVTNSKFHPKVAAFLYDKLQDKHTIIGDYLLDIITKNYGNNTPIVGAIKNLYLWNVICPPSNAVSNSFAERNKQINEQYPILEHKYSWDLKNNGLDAEDTKNIIHYINVVDVYNKSQVKEQELVEA